MVAGRNRVPSPAAGTTALRTGRGDVGAGEEWGAIMRPMLARRDERGPGEAWEAAVELRVPPRGTGAVRELKISCAIGVLAHTS
ncbi:hypothetical protein GCM10011578_068930 [Streptomyces fuscichromogenes]|uniref:Uncharacterized protein n=1 Tax=Streptomyces fuscichromogenes TaxID=1324013 RepID=A0A917XJJ0_9ACTN|nr:hypothetical protein GCM10011578_068930 [Streptomyces fuscichromogenes]